MRLLVLGPMEFWGADGQTPLGGPKVRALLAMLALSANRTLSERTLMDGLWGEEPPRSAVKVIQNLVLRVRKGLAAAGPHGMAIETRPGGYRLAAIPDEIDLGLLARLIRQARDAGGTKDPERAVVLLTEALALWRGEALTEFSAFPFAEPEIVRLAQLRQGLMEERLSCQLDCGEHRGCLAELEALAAANPYRENLWRLHMLALYRSGQQGQALQVYRRLRHALAEDLGLDPGPDLVAMELAILAQDARLDWVQASMPRGVVTFLATQVEDATRLLGDLGPEYPVHLHGYHAIMRDALRRRGGREVRADSAGFLAAFANPLDAVHAAIAAQCALQDHPQFRGDHGIRMGLHRGAATPGGSSYVCLAVHQADHLATAAHGGQALVSQSCCEVVAHCLPGLASLTDLGTHQLRGFPEAQPVYQLNPSGIVGSFPPLRAPALIAHNLPHSRTRFIGRAGEGSAVLRLLASHGVVTVVGPGGVGKTRLALKIAADIAERYPDGVWLVELASLSAHELVPAAVARAVGVVDNPGQNPTESLAAALRDHQALLVLDNCEHLIVAVAQLAEALTRRCPRIDILATSREPLRVDGEAVWRLAPLPSPPSGQYADLVALSSYDAVQLFVDRAQLSAPGFTLDAGNADAIAMVTNGVDGIPLALELAAARVGELGVHEMADSLGDRLQLLSRGRRAALPRQQTMEGAIAWSYDLLAGEEQRLFSSLSVFAGGFAAAAVEAVCGMGCPAGKSAEILTTLVSKSLVSEHVDPGARRYSMLQTVQDYAATRLDEASQGCSLQAAHADWFLALVSRGSQAMDRLGEGNWLDEVERDHDNVRRALRWALSASAFGLGLTLAIRTAPFWDIRGHLSEGIAWLDEALATAGDAPGLLRAEGMLAVAHLLAQVDPSASRRRSAEAAELLRPLDQHQLLARALLQHAFGDSVAGGSPAARSCLEESLALVRGAGDDVGVALALGRLAEVARNEGDLVRAQALMQESLDLHRHQGNLREVAWALGGLGMIRDWQDDLTGADALFLESGLLHRQLGHPQGEAWVACARAGLALARGELADARAGFQQALSVLQDLGCTYDSQWAVVGLGMVALAAGDLVTARCRFEDNLRLQRSGGGDTKEGLAVALHHLGVLAVQEGNHAAGVVILAASHAGRQSDSDRLSRWDAAQRDQARDEARSQLGSALFESLWAEGTTKSASAVLAMALDPCPKPAVG